MNTTLHTNRLTQPGIQTRTSRALADWNVVVFFGFVFMLVSALMLVLAVPGIATAVVQDPTEETQQDDEQSAQRQELQKSELGARQQLVERKMVELEGKLRVIADRLRPKEKERADRLIEAYQQAKERLITKQMAEVTRLLNENQLTEAGQVLAQVIRDIEDLVRLLTQDDEQKLTKQQEIDLFEKVKNDIQDLQQEQKQQTRETTKVGNKEETVDKLQAQIEKLNDLIGRQKGVIEKTNEGDGNNLREMDRLADEQFGIRQETENLIKDIAADPTSEIGDGESKDGEAKDGEGQSGESKDGEAKDGEGQSGEPKDGQPKDGEGQSGEPKDGEPKDGEGQSGEPKDGEPKDGEGQSGEPKDGEPKDGEPKDGEGQLGEPKAGEPKDGEGQSGEPKDGQGQSGEQPPQPPQPGQESLEKAAEHQRRAEEKLGSGKTDDAERQEQMALDEMEKSKDDLEKEMRRIESLPPEAFEKLAEKQRRMRDKALDVVKALKDMPKKDQQDPQNVSQQDGQQPQPGEQQMQQASDDMQNASEDLDEQNPEDAEKQQQQAEQQMQEALDDIEERLNQLREETREEKLARLEGRFREMLERQMVASVMTVELDDKKTSLGELRRRDQLVMLRLATEEMEISELGQQAYDLLLEDGTSEVFPEIVQGIRDDLDRVTSFLETGRTDQLTQLIQKDIEATIEQLLEALKEAKKKAEEGGGGGGGGGGEQEEQPLLKLSAEYKILKFRQIRINRRTIQLERIRGEQDAAQNPGDEQLEAEFDNAAAEQETLLEMIEELIKKQQQQGPEGIGQ